MAGRAKGCDRKERLGNDVNKEITFKAKAKAKNFSFKNKDLAFTQQMLTRKIKPFLILRLSTDCQLPRNKHVPQ